MNIGDGVVRRRPQGRGVLPATSAAAGSTFVVLHAYGVATIPGSGPAAAAEDEQLEPKHQYHGGGIWWRDLSTTRSSKMRNHARGERERNWMPSKGEGAPIYIGGGRRPPPLGAVWD